MGWIAATITETDVITTFAAQYLQDAGSEAKLTDCTARPGKGVGVWPDVWIVVRCQHENGALFVYPADRFGRLLDGVPLSEQSDMPKA